MPDVPPPEELPNVRDLMSAATADLPESMRAYWRREHPIDVRIVDASRYVSREPQARQPVDLAEGQRSSER